MLVAKLGLQFLAGSPGTRHHQMAQTTESTHSEGRAPHLLGLPGPHRLRHGCPGRAKTRNNTLLTHQSACLAHWPLLVPSASLSIGWLAVSEAQCSIMSAATGSTSSASNDANVGCGCGRLAFLMQHKHSAVLQ